MDKQTPPGGRKGQCLFGLSWWFGQKEPTSVWCGVTKNFLLEKIFIFIISLQHSNLVNPTSLFKAIYFLRSLIKEVYYVYYKSKP